MEVMCWGGGEIWRVGEEVVVVVFAFMAVMMEWVWDWICEKYSGVRLRVDTMVSTTGWGVVVPVGRVEGGLWSWVMRLETSWGMDGGGCGV